MVRDYGNEWSLFPNFGRMRAIFYPEVLFISHLLLGLSARSDLSSAYSVVDLSTVT